MEDVVQAQCGWNQNKVDQDNGSHGSCWSQSNEKEGHKKITSKSVYKPQDVADGNSEDIS